MADEKTPWTAERLKELVRSKYEDKPGNGSNSRYVVCEEVADGTGFNVGRHIDAVAFALWPMDGLRRQAFEVKVSRQDFLRELNQPEKHKWCFDSFHFFWFVAPKDVVQLEELPTGAGFMYPRGEQLCIGRHPTLNPNPKLDDVLLAAFMRSAWKAIQSEKKAATSDFLRNDPTYLRAKMYEKAVLEFLSNHDSLHGALKTPEDIAAALREATMDKELLLERDHLVTLLNRFQDQLLDSLSTYATFAGGALLAKDEMGRFLLQRWGANDKEAISVLSQTLKKTKDPAKADRETLTEMVREAGVPHG